MEKSTYFCRRNLVISLFLIIMFSSIGFGSDESVSPDWICIPGVKVGPITSTTSESDLINIFGKANVKREEIHIDEGYFEIGTFVFKGTPNEISIFWKQQDVSNPKFPRRAIIQSAGTNWITEDGLTIGTTIEELLKINGDHFNFAGFGWDYEGVVGPWGNGKLKDKKISIRLTPEHYVRIEDFEGDGAKVSSEDPRIKQLGLYVSRFDIIF